MDRELKARRQQTIARAASVSGFGLFTGADVRLEFCPAPDDHGIVFERTDLRDSVRIPALIDYVAPQPRCTVLAHRGTTVTTVEHVLAALAGLGVDNCLVRLDAGEPPAGDGSAGLFVEALLKAGLAPQDRIRTTVRIPEPLVHAESGDVGMGVQPPVHDEYRIGFILDYGSGPIGRQSLSLEITPETFVSELAECRTFVLEREVCQLRAHGLALRATAANALVFGERGLLENTLRRPDECVRHKILDCVGDFALLGCGISGRFAALRSGHRLNHEIIRLIRGVATHAESPPTGRRAG